MNLENMLNSANGSMIIPPLLSGLAVFFITSLFFVWVIRRRSKAWGREKLEMRGLSKMHHGKLIDLVENATTVNGIKKLRSFLMRTISETEAQVIDGDTVEIDYGGSFASSLKEESPLPPLQDILRKRAEILESSRDNFIVATYTNEETKKLTVADNDGEKLDPEKVKLLNEIDKVLQIQAKKSAEQDNLDIAYFRKNLMKVLEVPSVEEYKDMARKAPGKASFHKHMVNRDGQSYFQECKMVDLKMGDLFKTSNDDKNQVLVAMSNPYQRLGVLTIDTKIDDQSVVSFIEWCRRVMSPKGLHKETESHLNNLYGNAGRYLTNQNRMSGRTTARCLYAAYYDSPVRSIGNEDDGSCEARGWHGLVVAQEREKHNLQAKAIEEHIWFPAFENVAKKQV